MKFIHLATIAVICATAEAVRIAAGDDQIVETPDNFKKDSDDIFMRSMYEKYASHPKDMKTKKDIKEKVIITRGAALSLAIEVLETHKKLDGEKKMQYIDTYFDKAWKHFDVNGLDYIEVGQAPSFVRFLLSDQHANIYSQKK